MATNHFAFNNHYQFQQQIFRWLTAIVITALLIAGLPVQTAQAVGSILYVKPGTSGDCLSWATACDLQAALAAAEAGDEIRVSQGTYKPSTTGNREASFNLVDSVDIYGGYSSDGSIRDWTLYPTTLSGDYNGDDANEFVNYIENSYHVVKAVAVTNILLDGLTISGGNANGEENLGRGGGVYSNASTLTLNNLTITGNTAISGAGMFNDNSTLYLEDVNFVDNYATGPLLTGGGGGMYNDGTTLTLDDVNFERNYSFRGGGVVLEDYSAMTVNGGVFSENAAYFDGGNHFDSKSAGGAILAVSGSSLMVDGTTFSGNQANDGGAITTMYINPIIKNAIFMNNQASKPNPGFTIYGGGGGFFGHGGSPTLVNAQFISNTAEYGGGSDTYLVVNASYTNVTFVGNSATYGGGYSHTNGTAVITNATFAKNSASDSGGGIWNMDSGNLVINNSIIWGNTAPIGPGQYNYSDSPSNVITSECSIIQDCMTDGIWDPTCGTESDTNLYSDPLFVDLANNNVHLQSGSPALDSGCNSLVPADSTDLDGDGNTSELLPLDLAGNPRIANDPSVLPDAGVVDRGAYERTNENVTASDLNLQPNEDSVVTSQVTASGGTGLTFAANTPPNVSGLAFTFNPDGTFNYTPPQNFTGPVTFTFVVTDSLSNTDTGQVTMTFQPVNDSPVNTALPSISGSPHVGKPLSATNGVWNDNLDGGTSTITYTHQWQRADDAAGANLIDIAGATAQNYTPVLADNGKYVRIKVTATDDGVGLPPAQSASANSSYLLVDNADPVANDITRESLLGGIQTGQVTATDPDGDTLTYSLASGPDVGVLDFQPSGSFTYTPPIGLGGQVVFTFTVSDGLGGIDTGTVTITYPFPYYLPIILY